MSNPAFIVDGFTESGIVKRICPDSKVQRIDLNGKNVTIEAMAKKIASMIRLLNNNYYPIIILVDKEERTLSFEEMANQIRVELNNVGITDQDLRIGVADRMIENWIIADWQNFAGSDEHKPETTDGCNGASVIKKHKKSYHKTTDGVDYFVNANPTEIYLNSPSFKYFIDQLGDVSCYYTNLLKQDV